VFPGKPQRSLLSYRVNSFVGGANVHPSSTPSIGTRGRRRCREVGATLEQRRVKTRRAGAVGV